MPSNNDIFNLLCILWTVLTVSILLITIIVDNNFFDKFVIYFISRPCAFLKVNFSYYFFNRKIDINNLSLSEKKFLLLCYGQIRNTIDGKFHINNLEFYYDQSSKILYQYYYNNLDYKCPISFEKFEKIILMSERKNQKLNLKSNLLIEKLENLERDIDLETKLFN